MSADARQQTAEAELGAVRAELAYINRWIEAVVKDLNGNGTPGMKATIGELEARVRVLNKAIESLERDRDINAGRLSDGDIRFRFAVLYWLVGVAMTGAVGMFWNLFEALVAKLGAMP